jgi:hypothetical protein
MCAKCLGRVCGLQILAIGTHKCAYVYLRDSYLDGLSLYIVRIFVLDMWVGFLAEYVQDIEHRGSLRSVHTCVARRS